MKLLMFTQKVDINDDLLGFVHGWIEKLAEKTEKLYVVALWVGEYHLPKNVEVFSLGKEEYFKSFVIIRRFIAFFRFYKYIWQLRKRYDSVFVHMNLEYIFLGGWFWWLLGKKIVLWYAHYIVDWRVKLAILFTNLVATSTSLACNVSDKKLRVVGQGIDINKFRVESPAYVKTSADKRKLKACPEHVERVESRDRIFHVLYLGRISKIKKIDLLLKAFTKLTDKHNNLFLDIVGRPTPVDQQYFEYVKSMIDELGLKDKIKFHGKIPNYKTIEIYNQADLYINLTPTGSFDKTSLEAMACETPTITCNKAFYEYFDENLQNKMIFEEDDKGDLFKKIDNFLFLSESERAEVGRQQREIVVKHHSLDNLINNLIDLLRKDFRSEIHKF